MLEGRLARCEPFPVVRRPERLLRAIPLLVEHVHKASWQFEAAARRSRVGRGRRARRIPAEPLEPSWPPRVRTQPRALVPRPPPRPPVQPSWPRRSDPQPHPRRDWAINPRGQRALVGNRPGSWPVERWLHPPRSPPYMAAISVAFACSADASAVVTGSVCVCGTEGFVASAAPQPQRPRQAAGPRPQPRLRQRKT